MLDDYYVTLLYARSYARAARSCDAMRHTPRGLLPSFSLRCASLVKAHMPSHIIADTHITLLLIAR